MDQTQPARNAWIYYCLLAILLWGIFGVVARKAEQHMSPAAIQAISTLGVVPAGLVLLFSPNLKKGKNFFIGGLAAFFTGVCGSVGNYLMLLSFKHGGEASTVIPLTGMFPIVTIALAVPLLGERINKIQAVGIAISLFALYLFNKQPAATDTAGPVLQKLISAWMAYALGAMVLWAVAAVLQKIATNHISTELSTILFVLAFIPVAAVVAMLEKVQWTGHSPAAWAFTLSYGALIGVGTLVLFAAYRGGKASIVTALYALYPAITVLLAVPFLDEKIGLRTGIAIGLALIAGVALTFETPAAPATMEAAAL